MKAGTHMVLVARSGLCTLFPTFSDLQAMPALLKAEMPIKDYGQTRWV